MANERRVADRRGSSGAGETPSPIGAGVALESQLYQASVDQLRARGCRCVLRWDRDRRQAVPLTLAEAIDCPAFHADHADDAGNSAEM